MISQYALEYITQCTRPQSINRNYCETNYDVTSAHKVIVFLASLDLGSGCRYGHYIGIIRTFLSLFAQRRRRLSAQVIYRWKLESLRLWPTTLSLAICVYLIVLYRSFVRQRGSRVQWSRRRKQISALKRRVEVIQGQSFYAHWKADTLLHVAV